MGELVHLALRVGYLGDAFHGSQIQPDVVTVQGELQRVLRLLGWWNSEEHTMILGSRTDAGVNVRRNGGLLTLDRELYEKIGDRKLVRAMADRLPDHLAVLDATEVPEGWNPRLADHRVYRYRLEGMEGWWADDLEVARALGIDVDRVNPQLHSGLDGDRQIVRTRVLRINIEVRCTVVRTTAQERVHPPTAVLSLSLVCH